MTRRLRWWGRTTAAFLAMALLACGDDDDQAALPPPDLVTFERLNLQPEGLEYDEVGGRFVVGSTTTGTIHSVDDEGNLEVLVADPGLAGTVGLHIDRATDLLYAAGNLADGSAALGVYDLADGELVHLVEIGHMTSNLPQLANDVVVDGDGTAYLTDTLRGVVYTVEPELGVVSAVTPGAPLANGIELYEDVLLVARIGGPLMRLVVGEPASLEPVETDVPVSGDGIVLTPQGDLAVVTVDGPASVILLRSDDGWQSARLVGTWDSTTITDSEPTTAAIRGDAVYVVFARLFDTENARYDIERVAFDMVE